MRSPLYANLQPISAMNEPISSIRNLGPAMEKAFIKAGIPDANALRALDPDYAYTTLLQSGHPPHFIAYYAMIMGLQGRPWNDPSPQEKHQLRQRFDAIKASLKPNKKDPSDIERILDKIGVRNPD